MSRTEPIFNVPTVVVAVLALLGAVHVVYGWLLPEDLAERATATLAFIPARYGGGVEPFPGGWIAAVVSPFSHMLLHADLTHLGLNCAWLLVFGTIVARRLGAARFVAFAVLTGWAGALLFTLANWGSAAPMIGASGAVSGLMGGAIRLLVSGIRAGRVRELTEPGATVPLLGLGETLRDRSTLVVLGVTLLVNLALGLTGDALTPNAGGIAWEAHVGGFLVGLVGFGWFDRPASPPPRPEAEPTGSLDA